MELQKKPVRRSAVRQPNRHRSTGSSGFALVLVVLLLGLLLSLGAALSLALVNQGQNAVEFESQLSSLIVAANGIEYARCVLPSLSITETLRGPDGQLRDGGTGWRNPLSLEQARRLEPSAWRPLTDDGIPTWNGVPLLSGAYRSEPGYLALKFSNNAEEPPDQDEDGVVVVRSVGMVPERQILGGRRNSACLIEALFRQEREFEPHAAVTVFAEEADLVFEGDNSTIEGGDVPAVAIVSTTELSRKVSDSLKYLPDDRVSGGGLRPSVQDLTIEHLSSKRHRSIFSARFWSHLIENLPDFSDTSDPGIAYIHGGRLSGNFHGVLVTEGDIHLDGTVDGLLLHLGNGKLTLAGEARVRGAVWMANVDCEKPQLAHRPVRLDLADFATVQFDAELADEALSWLPPTQLGWRILFSEMPG